MFWQNYLDLCNKTGKAPNVVASEIGIKSTGTVTGWKNGAMPRPNALLKIADYFGVPVESLTEEKENPAAQNSDTADVLTEQERHFIQMTRQMPPIQRDSLLKFLEFSVRNSL